MLCKETEVAYAELAAVVKPSAKAKKTRNTPSEASPIYAAIDHRLPARRCHDNRHHGNNNSSSLPLRKMQMSPYLPADR